ncbi:hypothetical protein [Methylibium sp.]|uniref:hypothetical protein n=1 Tax=Methylibium sp. TaxID=2067992 RepID=UPI003D0D4AC9
MIHFDGAVLEPSGVISVSLADLDDAVTLCATPGSGCTVTVELSYNKERSWTAWALGAVTSATVGSLDSGQLPTHVRLTRTVGSAPCFLTVVK